MKGRLLVLTALVIALFGMEMGPALAQEGDTPATTTTVSDAGASEEGGGESLLGTLTYKAINEETDETEDLPVEGGAVTVALDGGAVLETVVTDATGAFELQLPGPGTYTAALDPATLPDGVEFVNEEDDGIRTVPVSPGEAKRLLFPLKAEGVEVGGGGESFIEQLARLTVEGIKFGLTIAMMAVGLSLIFGTTGLVNFAHGELVAMGAIVTWYINSWGFWLPFAAVLGMGVMFLFGVGLDARLWAPLRRRGVSLISMLVISIGLSIFLRYLLLYIFGGRSRAYQDFQGQQGIDFGFVIIAPKDLWSIGISLVVLTGVGLVLQRSRIGKAIRAVADNRDLAASSGIDVEQVIRTVWGVGAALAALGGVLFAVGEFADWQSGFRLLLLIFAGVTLGGLGTAYGAFVGSLIVGIFVQVSTIWVPTELKNVGALAVLILILVFRPQGILGQRERVG